MELWTATHAQLQQLLWALMLAVTLVLRKTIGNKPLHIRLIPLQVLAVLLLVLEVGKQLVSVSNGYDLYHIPLHFCSLMLPAMPLLAFYRGKNAETVRGVCCTAVFAITLLMVIYPALIYSADNIKNYFKGFMDMHTVTFHNVVVFAFMLIVALKINQPSGRQETKVILIATVIYCIIAATMSHVLQTNYANFYQCNIGPLREVQLAVQQALGFGPAQLLYSAILTVLHIGFLQGTYQLYKLLLKLFNRKKAVTI